MQIIFFPSHNLSLFPLCPFSFWIIFFVCLYSCDFLHLNFFFFDFDCYYIVRTDEGQPRPKYIFNNSINVELTSTFLTLQRFGPSPSPNFKQTNENEAQQLCRVNPFYQTSDYITYYRYLLSNNFTLMSSSNSIVFWFLLYTVHRN